MATKIDDLCIDVIHPLVAPVVMMEKLALTDRETSFIAGVRSQTRKILSGEDDRLIVVVGPCSIHDPALALEYAEKLRPMIAQYDKDLQIIMRVYFEKPRTTVGWKGLINDPHLDGSFDINQGLKTARTLLLDLAKSGVAAGTEFLDTVSPQYIADLVSWGAIGARTTESQIHRELASGLSMPVGFKNGTAGSIGIAVDAIGAAAGQHSFLGVTKQGVSAIVRTKGNNTCHVILRGGKDGPNYGAEHVADCVTALEAAKLEPTVMIDCSHGNSNKDFRNQHAVAKDIAGQLASGTKAITGVMVESHLVEGNQKVIEGQDLVHGQSITDACVGWEETEEILETLAKGVRARRG